MTRARARGEATRGAALFALALAACSPENGPLMSPGEDCLECHGGGGLPGEPPTIGDREGARRWTIAGTVFPSATAAPGDGVRGAKVHVRDANGRSFTLETNRAGNFYTAESVRFPLRVRVEHGGSAGEMEDDVPYGGCNACHRLPPRRDAPGRVNARGEGRGDGPLMMPGENCLECHGGAALEGEAPTVAAPRDAPPWTVAGTVFASNTAAANEGVEGAKVHLRDRVGRTLTLETNRAGNFYTAEPLAFPLRVALEHGGIVAEMGPDAPYGGCNACHRLPPRREAPGRVSIRGPFMMPGENCLECHGGRSLPGEPPTIANPTDAPPWTVAGTVFASEDAAASQGVEGARVHLRDVVGRTLTLETNRAGNFYTAEPLAFPLRVAVEHGGVVAEMDPDVPYGGCNACHRLPPRQDAPGRVTVQGDDD